MARYITCSRQQREEREREEQERLAMERRRRERARSRGRVTRARARNVAAATSNENSESSAGGARRQASDELSTPTVMQRIQAFIGDDEDEPDRFFIVDKILKKRQDREGNVEYLVRWQNYPPSYDSWEPRSELQQNSLAMINEFEGVPDNETTELNCICRMPYTARSGGMIQCFTCSEWYHFSCLNMNMVEANSYARWHCEGCRTSRNLRNLIKPQRIRAIVGNTQLVDIEQVEHQVTISEDGQYMI